MTKSVLLIFLRLIFSSDSTKADKLEKTPRAEVEDSSDVEKLFKAVESKQRKNQDNKKKSVQLPTLVQASTSAATYQEAMWNSFPTAEETARVSAEEKLRETRESLRGLFARHSYENNTDSLDLLQLLELNSQVTLK